MSESRLALDQLNVMLNVESKYRVPPNSSLAMSEGSRYSEWRKKICHWSFKVIDHFEFDREVVSRAMNILDRYSALKTKRDRDATDSCHDDASIEIINSRSFQLVAMTSLYLAVKLSDNDECQYTSSRKLRLTSFVELSRSQFCSDEITEMERTILHELQWEVFPPTPMLYVSYLLHLMPSHETLPHASHQSYSLVLHVLHELARYLTELSVCHGSISAMYTSSQIAYSAILLSMELLTPIALPVGVRDTFNEAVALTSLRSGGTTISAQDDKIKDLQEVLRESFWPEMLVEDCEYAEIGHPISMAKDFGLLDISSVISPDHAVSTKSASLSCCRPLSEPFEEPDLRDSPVCVNRHY